MPHATPLAELLPLPQVAAYLSRSTRTVRRWCNRGLLQSVKINGRIYVYVDSLVQLVCSADHPVLEGTPSVRQPGGQACASKTS